MSTLVCPTSVIRGHGIDEHKKSLGASAIKLSSQIALTTGIDDVGIQSLQEKNIISVLNHGIYDCSISASGEKIVTICHDGAMRLWSGKDGKLRYETKSLPSTSLVSCWISSSGSTVIFTSGRPPRSRRQITVLNWCNDESIRLRSKRYIFDTVDRVKVSVEQEIYAYRSGSKLSVRNISNDHALSSLDFDSESYPRFDFALAKSRIAFAIACDSLFVKFVEDYVDDIHLPRYDPPAEEALCDINSNGSIVVASCRD
eukprot:IDg21577t1